MKRNVSGGQRPSPRNALKPTTLTTTFATMMARTTIGSSAGAHRPGCRPARRAGSGVRPRCRRYARPAWPSPPPCPGVAWCPTAGRSAHRPPSDVGAGCARPRRDTGSASSRVTGPDRLSRGAGVGELSRLAGASAPAVRWVRISYADSRLTAVSYLRADRAAARTAARSSGVIAPMRQRGGAISARSTGIGTPLSCSIDTSASPTAELRDHLGDVELGIGREGLGRRAHGLLIARRVGAQRVLDAVAELAEDLARHVVGKLRAEVHAHALRADEPHHLLDALAQRRPARRRTAGAPRRR